MKNKRFFGNWEIDCELGSGSFGTVYKIKKEEFGVTYYSAMKVIRIPQDKSDKARLISEGMDEKSISAYYQHFVQDFTKEIELMVSLQGNTNVVGYNDHIIEENEDGIGFTIYIRMEYLTPLDQYLVNENNDTHYMTQDEVIKLGLDLCNALEICSKKHIIHRDIKPDNIFVSENGDFKLGDFGVARQLESTQSNLSKKGTYTYMAPEIYNGKPYNSTVDIYSLGIVLYRLLNKNRTPFLPFAPEPIRYTDKERALINRMSGTPIPEIPGVPDELNKIILKACAFNPKERYQTVGEFKTALIAVSEEPTWRAPFSNAVVEKPVQETPIENDLETDVQDELENEATVSPFNNFEPVDSEADEQENNDEGLDKTVGAFSGPKPTTDKDDNQKSKKKKLLIIISCLLLLILFIIIVSGKSNGDSSVNDVNHTESATITTTAETTDEPTTITTTTETTTKPTTEPTTTTTKKETTTQKQTTTQKASTTKQETTTQKETTTKQKPTASGSCGANVNWAFYESTGELIISGSGKMDDFFSENGGPWNDYYPFGDNIKTVEIQSGVTTIGYNAFLYCYNLKSVTIPNGVISIGEGAFYYCESLTSITIPNSVTSIGDRAFGYCTSLKSVTIPNGVKSIGEGEFYFCSSLTSVTIPNSVKNIGDWAFEGCKNLASITIPNSVTSIGDCAFGYCTSLKSVTIPNGVKSIGEYAFSDCSSLTSITIPKSVTFINSYAFGLCENLSDIYYTGSKKQWNEIAMGEGSIPDSATIHYK